VAQSSTLVVACDVGTTGCKTRLLGLGDGVEVVAEHYGSYPLYTTPDGGVEQNPDEWWAAVCATIMALGKEHPELLGKVSGIAFCCQMQGSIHVDRSGRPLRNAMIYMDGRSREQLRKGLASGLVRVQGLNLFKTLRSLRVAGGVSTSAKDPVWKYHWVRDNQPELFEKTHKWLDVKDYLLLRLTGNIAMTRDSANATFLFDTRPKNLRWDEGLCSTFEVNMEHLPEVVGATDVVGRVTRAASEETGLPEGTPVFGGGGDASLIPVGAGCSSLHDTHVYSGTSGWVISNVDRRIVDPIRFVASILGAQPGRYNLIAEQEVSGYCLEWIKNLVLGTGLGHPDANRFSYDDLEQAVASVKPGADGLIFAPWLHGLRAPNENPLARGIFFNMGLRTSGAHMARAVVEGIAMQTRWMLEAVEHHVPRNKSLKFVGGGARLPSFAPILANVTGRTVKVPARPQDAGALGVGVVCGAGLGLWSVEDSGQILSSVVEVEPLNNLASMYDEKFQVFKKLLPRNSRAFGRLNGGESS